MQIALLRRLYTYFFLSPGKVLVHVCVSPLYIVLVALYAFLHASCSGRSLQLLADELRVVLFPVAQVVLFFLVHGPVVAHVLAPLLLTPVRVGGHLGQPASLLLLGHG